MRDPISMIPLSSLKASKRNVRKTNRSSDIQALAESIKAHGLLQNLTVRATGTSGAKAYEVIAGGRRLTALKLLVKRKVFVSDHEVPCRVLSNQDPTDNELSLAENELRVPLHPADQFEAFTKLHADGVGLEEIAARFGVASSIVSKRLKLAAVSPRLMAEYRDETLSLDQLMAFTVSDDHEEQERVWFEAGDRHPSAHDIRRALTAAHVTAGDRRARFVGAHAYEEAGGTVIRDLFRPDDQGYFTDSKLLDRLASEKLSEAASNVAAEGWRWIESRLDMDYEYIGRFSRLPSDVMPLTKEEEKNLSELGERYDAMVADLGDEPSSEAIAEIDALDAEINHLSGPKEVWGDDAKAQSGALVVLDHEGCVTVIRGLADPSTPQAEGAEKKKSARSRKGGIPTGLREELSAYRTAALRVELSRSPGIAFRALVHALVLRMFYGPQFATCIDVRPVAADLRTCAEGIGESAAVQAYTEQHVAFAESLPGEPEALWSWLGERTLEVNLELLAHCVGGALNALWRRNDQSQDWRLAQADILATDIGLDMSEWWQATRVSYFDHVTKDAILDAVAEGASKQAANNIVSLKKGAIAARAEDLLKQTQWLPEPLRPRAVG